MNTIIFLFLFLNIQLSLSLWEFDDAPGIAFEYKIFIDPGKEDCYWQHVHEKASLYVSLQVIKGGDGMAGLLVKNPRNEIVHPYDWQQSGEYEEGEATGGYYTICIDNQYSRYASKLVNLYITTFRNDVWEAYSKEVESLEISVQNFTEAIRKVDNNIHHMLQFQSLSRSKEGRHYKLLVSNNSFIMYWSLAQCVAIIGCGLLQVYSIRSFFKS